MEYIKLNRGIYIRLKKRTVLRTAVRNNEPTRDDSGSGRSSGDGNGDRGGSSSRSSSSSSSSRSSSGSSSGSNGGDSRGGNGGSSNGGNDKAPTGRPGTFVLPGDFIGTTEEFRSGERTYEKAGGIYAAATGVTMVNAAKRFVSVIPETNTPPILRKGDVVVGQVTGLREALALVAIAGTEGVVDREITNVAPAVVHVSNVKKAYVKELSYEFGLFDILKAKVIDIKNMRLDTSEPKLGVVKAFCSKCRTAMVRQDSKLKCPDCGRVETRKISTDYGTGIV